MRLPALLVLLAACGGSATPSGVPDGGPSLPDAGPVELGEVARGKVAINEISPKGDWVELAVRESTPVDVSGWFLSDAPDRLDHYYEFPQGTVLQPGSYLVIPTDDGVTGAPFKLGREDGVVLLDPDGVTIDVVLYLAPEDDSLTLQRVPDHEGRFRGGSPTPGSANP